MITPLNREKRILLSGVFDMQNYGDLLFPLIAEHRLGPLGYAVAPLAPTAAMSGLPDAMDPVSVPDVLGGGAVYDGIVLGGGYIIHSHRMDILREYKEGGVGEWAGPGLWLGTTLAAALRDVPIAWNAPGVPHPIAPSQRTLVDAALGAASYVSLRDHGGAELLSAPAGVPVAIVPDPIADLARMWPLHELEVPFRALLERKNCRADNGFVAVHFRNRSVAGQPATEVAAGLTAFAGAMGLTPIITAVGRTHNDDVLAREISACLDIPHIVLDDAASLKETAAAVAFSRFYIGASLHGYITAAAYGVPGVLVARPAYRKFAGFLEHTRRMEDLARDWPGAYRAALGRRGEPIAERIPATVFTALDTHWEAIAAVMADPQKNSAGRRRFLATYLAFSLKERGPQWAMQPIMHRAPRFTVAA